MALRVIPMYPPPAGDGPPLAPRVVAMPDPPAQIPNAEEARIADLSARLDETAGKLRASQQAREAFSKRVTELEAQLASATPGDATPQADPAQAARIEQLEAHIQQLDAHIKAAAADREKIVTALHRAPGSARSRPGSDARGRSRPGGEGPGARGAAAGRSGSSGRGSPRPHRASGSACGRPGSHTRGRSRPGGEDPGARGAAAGRSSRTAGARREPHRASGPTGRDLTGT